MDPLSDLLRDVRADGAIFSQAVLSPPFSLRFMDDVPLTMVTLLRGSGWIVTADGRRDRLEQWDTAVIRGGEPFVFTDDPDAVGVAAQEIHCVGDCGIDDLDCYDGMMWGNDPDGQTALAVGVYRAEGTRHLRLLEALPPVLVIGEDAAGRAVLEELMAEVTANRPGGQAVLDRLLDWGLVCTLRKWFEGPDSEPPAWYQAHSDPAVGRALRAMHRTPSANWTVEALANEAKVSRAWLAKRFSQLMGQSPLAYLTQWRMTLAEDLLAQPNSTVAAVAKRVGYANAFAFSAAFKRLYGVSPAQYRSARPAAVSAAA
ncbi:AraC family transcriptional regulator [Stackebrandtia nassauensis]|uniref:Transcriptional regulator, AraC family n=1 Tax=Stackebrandtia nassauensis (strain DSM 44728 / CIP 108903 / NRRL B-16338 / NBRC 102104 / LLR-40K-21) TaxID=446470 RepID=D3Q2R0_STANL|nr:AraC family transcriptional regulator [Stackebrandtia nassauensis]ADD45811.1 transcriptional regulator, AraC family [Stackebrandtia nassauensis DSM 44728]